MQRITQEQRSCAVASACAHDLNDELTIIVNSAALSLITLESGHPARQSMLELQSAAQRCVWKTSGLLNYTARRGVRPVNVSMERLILNRELGE